MSFNQLARNQTYKRSTRALVATIGHAAYSGVAVGGNYGQQGSSRALNQFKETIMRTETLKIFKFDELNDTAKTKVIEWYRHNDFFHGEYIIEDAKEIGKTIGINIENIWYSGFASQGDGSCFDGSYEYKKQSLKALCKHVGIETDHNKEVYRIARELITLQKPFFYQLNATIKHTGHYYHSGCTDINVSLHSYDDERDIEHASECIRELMRDFMNWVYTNLERGYDHVNSDENITENIQANKYEFTNDGCIH